MSELTTTRDVFASLLEEWIASLDSHGETLRSLTGSPRITIEQLDKLRAEYLSRFDRAERPPVSGAEADKLHAALRSLMLYTMAVHEESTMTRSEPAQEWTATDGLRDEALADLRAAGVKL